MLYCKDFEKYKNSQKWIIFDNGRKIIITAIRNENTYSWDGYIETNINNIYIVDVLNEIAHGGIIYMDDNKLGFGFGQYNDYKPKYEELGYYKQYFSKEKIENFTYWSFPDVKNELEKIASYYKMGEPVSS